jgi:hypothetical protein
MLMSAGSGFELLQQTSGQTALSGNGPTLGASPFARRCDPLLLVATTTRRASGDSCPRCTGGASCSLGRGCLCRSADSALGWRCLGRLGCTLRSGRTCRCGGLCRPADGALGWRCLGCGALGWGRPLDRSSTTATTYGGGGRQPTKDGQMHLADVDDVGGSIDLYAQYGNAGTTRVFVIEIAVRDRFFHGTSS